MMSLLMATKLFSMSNSHMDETRSALEGEFDHAQRVAPRQLYGLSEDEVRIVEGRE